jgi:biopolymer transport protein TolR
MMLVRGDRQASYDQVVQLMVLLQGAGAERVGLVTE